MPLISSWRQFGRSATWCLSIALALASGAVIAQIAGLTTTQLVATSQEDKMTVAAVTEFYAAANQVFQTGEVAVLDLIVASEFVAHGGPAIPPGNRADLRRQLLSIHTHTPHARLTADEVVAVGKRAIVQVTFANGETTEFLESSVIGVPIPWGTVDGFRVEDGKVVERWSNESDGSLLETLATFPVGTQLSANSGVVLERITLRPGETVAESNGECRLFLLESGTLAITVAPTSRDAGFVASAGVAQAEHLASGAKTLLEPGDAVFVSSIGEYSLFNDGAYPATAIVAAIHLQDSPTRIRANADPNHPGYATPWPTTVVVQSLISVVSAQMPEGSSQVSVGQITLAPGTSIPEISSSGPTLLTLEEGEISLNVSSDSAMIQDARTGARQKLSSAALSEGDGVFVPEGETIRLENPGKVLAIITMITIRPATG